MLNPINQKLKKMMNRSKKVAQTPLKRLMDRFKNTSNKQNQCGNSNSTTYHIDRHSSRSYDKLSSVEIGNVDAKLLECLKDNEQLKDMIKTHEMMEEFYLKELEFQKKQKKNLEWRLSLLSEELQHSTQSKAKIHKENNVQQTFLKQKVWQKTGQRLF